MMLISLVQGQETEYLKYPEAHAQFQKAKNPLIIVVTTPTCNYCKKLKVELSAIKKEYPAFVLCEVSPAEATKLFSFLDLKQGVPQTFMYVYDNEKGVTARLKPTIIGFKPKADLYRAWGIK